LRPQDGAFVGLSNSPSFDRNRAEKERAKLSFGFRSNTFRLEDDCGATRDDSGVSHAPRQAR
jgi:hypothetical protein